MDNIDFIHIVKTIPKTVYQISKKKKKGKWPFHFFSKDPAV